jgi:hypothetical protein
MWDARFLKVNTDYSSPQQYNTQYSSKQQRFKGAYALNLQNISSKRRFIYTSLHGGTFHYTESSSVEITNQMQPCNRTYYSKVYWKLNMFRAAYRSSSRALKLYLQPLVYIHMRWPAVVKVEWEMAAISHSALTTAGHHMGIYTRGCIIQFRAPNDERYAARNILSFQ